MKFSTIITALSLSNLAAAARLMGAEAEAFCGDLGVMPVPEGVDPNTLRTCLDHPLAGLDISVEVKKKSGDATRQRRNPLDALDKRSCWYGKPVGCTRGYCWKSCGAAGTGDWCWTAKGGDGKGSWETCHADKDCNGGMTCGGGGCSACGCDC